MQVEEEFDIKNHTAFKIGGKIKQVIFPENVEEFEAVLRMHKNPFIVGNLSNTLVSSYGYDGVVISTAKLCYTDIKNNIIISGAGTKGPKLAQIAAENGLSGLEFMIGFPGSVGGEVFMNAGASGQCVADCLKSAKIFDGSNVVVLNKNDMEFEYRNSICSKNGYVVLEAEFELQEQNPDIIKQKMADNLEFRKNHQPTLAQPNCGSIFKNPKGNSAGKLLDECKVKELQFGGARVWANHANFIINECDAQSYDVLELMSEMKKRVSEKFDIELEPEIRFLGGKNKKEVELCKYLKVR